MFRQSKFCVSVLNQLTGFSATPKRFAGHSKWANIKHDKAIKDREKSNIFHRFSRMIRIAIQDGGSPNPALNSYLRTVIDQALAKNMPMATINKNIQKFTSSEAKLTKHYFEIKTMNKVFVIVEAYTENFAGLKQTVYTAMRKAGNQTAFADIKHFFDEIGFVTVTKPDGKFANASEFEDKLTEDAIEVDAQEVEDVNFEEKTATFFCRPIDIEKVKRGLLNRGYVVEDSQHIFVPNAMLTLSEFEMKSYEIFKQKLSQLEGFENLYDNVNSSS